MLFFGLKYNEKVDQGINLKKILQKKNNNSG